MKTEHLCQTFHERLDDESKPPLDGAFIESLMMTAYRNARPVDDVWVMYRTYTQICESADQSPTFREFVAWNKLVGAGPLS